jgi:hypothetical protein
MTSKDHNEQVAEALSSAGNIRRIIDGLTEVENAIESLRPYRDAAEEAPNAPLDQAAATVEEAVSKYRSALGETASTFNGFACTVRLYQAGEMHHAQYKMEVHEDQNGQMILFQLGTDQDEDEHYPFKIHGVEAIKATSLTTGKDLDPGGFGTATTTACNNALLALRDDGVAEWDADSPTDLLVEPEV